MDVSGQLYAPAAFSQGKKPLVLGASGYFQRDFLIKFLYDFLSQFHRNLFIS
jgi:hypothetical protein